MRRVPETSEAFERRKAADFERWRRNSEPDPRERDVRDDDRHSRFRDPRRDPRLSHEDDNSSDADEEKDDA